MASTLTHPREQDCTGSRVGVTRRQFDVPAPLRLWHLASFDAPSIAVVWALGFAWAAQIHLPHWVPVLLALATWAVYVGDRLLDARAGLRSGTLHHLRDRHYFHWRHRGVLLVLAVSAAGAAAAIIFSLMPLGIRAHDSVLAVAALAYFSGVHSDRKVAQVAPAFLSRILSKEFLVGVLFTAGCFLPTLSRATASHLTLLWPVCGVAVFFAALAWLNCRSIECWESGKASCVPAACLLGLGGLLLAASFAGAQPRPAALLAAGAISAMLLALLDRIRGRLTPLALRVAADLVLLTPIALVLR